MRKLEYRGSCRYKSAVTNKFLKAVLRILYCLVRQHHYSLVVAKRSVSDLISIKNPMQLLPCVKYWPNTQRSLVVSGFPCSLGFGCVGCLSQYFFNRDICMPLCTVYQTSESFRSIPTVIISSLRRRMSPQTHIA